MKQRRHRHTSKRVTATLVAVASVLYAPLGASAAPSKAAVCFQALVDVHNRLSPVVEASGSALTLRVGPWDPAGTNLTVGEGYDAEVLRVADGSIELHLNCGTDRPVSRRQMRAAFRFLVVHEYTHVLQNAYGFPEFDPNGENSADCAAVLLMWSWRWAMSAGALDGSHGGCPDEMFVQQYEWLTNVGVEL
jgi:hypothetical protein